MKFTISKNYIVYPIIIYIFIVATVPAQSKVNPIINSPKTEIAEFYIWEQKYIKKYGESPNISSFSPKRFTIVEIDAETLKLVRHTYSVDKSLSFISALMTGNGNYVAIRYQDWNQRVNRNDIQGEYHSIRSFLVIVDSKATVIDTQTDVIFYLWLNNKIIFLGKGVATEDCPDFHVDKMEIVDVEKLTIVDVLDNTVFCGRAPVLSDRKLEFPCCSDEESKYYNIAF